MKIFQIGFNKCGTRSLFKLFKDEVICIHYKRKTFPDRHGYEVHGNYALKMLRNYRRTGDFLSDELRDVVFFSDLEDHEGDLYLFEQYKELYRQYPDSKFILNTREVQSWIRSRMAHNGGEYLSSIAVSKKMKWRDVVKEWRKKWDEHHKGVAEFFQDKPGSLLIFNIEEDPIEKVLSFVSPHVPLKIERWSHHGKTPRANSFLVCEKFAKMKPWLERYHGDHLTNRI